MWDTYFTSSKVVEEYRRIYGEPDVVEVRQVFNDSLQARLWEEKVLRRLDVVKSERWLNRCNAGKEFFNVGGYNLTESTKQKMSESKKGEKNTNYGKQFLDSTRHKMSLANKGEKNPFYGKQHTYSTKQKLSDLNKGKQLSDSTRQKMSESKKNMSDETRHKMSESKKNMSDETRKKISEAKRGTMTVFNITTKQMERITKEKYQTNRNVYFTTQSKEYKAFKQKKEGIETFFT